MQVLIGVGSNHAAAQYLPMGISLLQQRVTVIECSPVYQSQAIQPDAANYANAVILIDTDDPPEILKQQLLDIENACDRVRIDAQGNKSNIVSLDLDILDYGQQVRVYHFHGKEYRLPHDDIIRYDFIAIPLSDIYPDYIHPETGQAISEIVSHISADTLQPMPHIQIK